MVIVRVQCDECDEFVDHSSVSVYYNFRQLTLAGRTVYVVVCSDCEDAKEDIEQLIYDIANLKGQLVRQTATIKQELIATTSDIKADIKDKTEQLKVLQKEHAYKRQQKVKTKKTKR